MAILDLVTTIYLYMILTSKDDPHTDIMTKTTSSILSYNVFVEMFMIDYVKKHCWN